MDRGTGMNALSVIGEAVAFSVSGCLTVMWHALHGSACKPSRGQSVDIVSEMSTKSLWETCVSRPFFSPMTARSGLCDETIDRLSVDRLARHCPWKHLRWSGELIK